ncbi:NTP transferase domain-containing protein [Paenibacillus sp. CGMCC 1.16610]|uniref:NTP transferase domain-containing protein n=2 Tax=Paenibacillus TaxID=44249 RepID=A0ABU6DK96_9BACL|nr:MULTISPECIES: NTP transferase domain-containing protein [Paenibacillus]MBA2943588.1 NTP transferase domain-containing protein [Paenibacillus sp. CGMCC 1.16610]MCY9661000.1 NTP transferase domain-containing protein [Paenibacillus anseongense]MEB4797941.1 NTP transferase domain-containing protein [Paenibacillus chondroitinus]MVQ33084.1 NTP transferase domain-containing protein [Paenibacillus anseongense]
MEAFAILLAAGKGTRMKSELPKVLHPVGGVPMIGRLVGKLETMPITRIVAVIGHRGELVKKCLGTRVTYVQQEIQLGTAHAVHQTEPLLRKRSGSTLVLTGDTPLIRQSTIERLLAAQRANISAGVVLTAIVQDPTGYGRIIRDPASSEVVDIIEEKDATPEQKLINEINTGIFCFDNDSLFQALPGITNDNAQQEYYLTDIVKVMRQAGISGGKKRFEAIILEDPTEVMGINTPEQLEEANRAFYEHMGIFA